MKLLVGAFGMALLSVVPVAQAAERSRPVVVPPNAYATGATYGSGWSCNYGFNESRDECVEVAVPENGYLNDRGDDWLCQRGYRPERDGCERIDVPANGYLSELAQKGWECERGYRTTRSACEQINVPANAYLTNSSYGDLWRCERGYRQLENACQKVIVPEHAYLVDLPYGPGWTCERGYAIVGSRMCMKVEVPPNAHLSRQGDEWSCNAPFRRRGNGCVAD